jgi:hypothetical protein
MVVEEHACIKILLNFVKTVVSAQWWWAAAGNVVLL